MLLLITYLCGFITGAAVRTSQLNQSRDSRRHAGSYPAKYLLNMNERLLINMIIMDRFCMKTK